MRIFWLSLGVSSLGLAVLGVALPLLPATPFAILSAFCFARYSPRLEERILHSSTFGKPIRDWRDNRAISRRSKLASMIAMAASLVLSAILRIDPVFLAIQALVLACAAAFILTRRSAS